MKYARIVPPQLEHQYPSGNFRMVLAHWVRDYEDYRNFLRTRTEDFVLIDNGVFEGRQVSLEELSKLARSVRANEVVLPDVQGNPKETLELSWAALDKLVTSDCMFVPQGRTEEEWKACLKAWMTKWETPRRRPSTRLSIGITSLRKEDMKTPSPGTRAELMKFAAGFDKPLHLLGVGNPKSFVETELEMATSLNVRSMDTSLAFALAYKSTLLTPTVAKVKLGMPEDYTGFTERQKRLARLNQMILQTWITEGRATELISTVGIRQLTSKWRKYYIQGLASIEDVMLAACMPYGRYALSLEGRLEKSIRPLGKIERLKDEEKLVKLEPVRR